MQKLRNFNILHFPATFRTFFELHPDIKWFKKTQQGLILVSRGKFEGIIEIVVGIGLKKLCNNRKARFLTN